MKYIAIIFTAMTMLLTSHVVTATEPQMHAVAQSVESATLTTEVQSESSTTKPKKATKKKKAKKKKTTKKQTKPKSTNAKKETKPKKTTKKPAKKAKTSKSVSTNATTDFQRADLKTTDQNSLKVTEPDALGQLVNSGVVDLQAQSTEEAVPPAARKGLAIAGVSGLGGLGLMLLLKKFFLH